MNHFQSHIPGNRRNSRSETRHIFRPARIGMALHLRIFFSLIYKSKLGFGVIGCHNNQMLMHSVDPQLLDLFIDGYPP